MEYQTKTNGKTIAAMDILNSDSISFFVNGLELALDL
jgi:hypothetical protein|tara:strand:+ start:203 stop:313 length:111 start_codon:yes stop_codon:yes gene_type:complete